MQIVTSDSEKSIARVALKGKLDIVGAEVVALPLATLAGAKQGMIIDMGEVSFIASIGIRHLLTTAKALSRRNGRLVLLNPNSMVAEVLTTSGVTDLLPMVYSEAAALSAVGVSQPG
jgi:anti-anti-sigma factor